MTQRTFNIIMACKGNLFGEIPAAADRVRHYMADVCGCEVSSYDESVLEGILFNAFTDYIDTCDKPSAFLKEWKWIAGLFPYNTPTKRMIAALGGTQVRNDNGYVNGFTDELYCNIGKE